MSEDIFRHQANALRGQICFFPINVPDLFIINILVHIHCFDIVHTEWQDILIVDGVHNRIGMKLIAESLCRSPQRRLFTDTGIGGKDRRSRETKQVILLEIPGNGKVHITKLAAVAFVENNDHTLVKYTVSGIFLDEGGQLLNGSNDDLRTIILQLTL